MLSIWGYVTTVPILRSLKSRPIFFELASNQEAIVNHYNTVLLTKHCISLVIHSCIRPRLSLLNILSNILLDTLNNMVSYVIYYQITGHSYKRTLSLKDKLTSSHYSANPCWCRHHQHGITRCGKCAFCSWIYVGTQFMLPNGERFSPNFHADCDTQGVVYLMSCKCGAFYVRKTARHFRCLRIKDHVYSANSKMLTAVNGHLDLYHKFDVSLVSFIALPWWSPKIPGGGKWDKFILQRETIWIERLNAKHAPGINEAQSYKPSP